MIGQQELLDKLSQYTITTLPQALLFIGEYGCGKHTVAEKLAKDLELELIEIPNTISNDDIIEYQRSLLQKLFVINISDFTEKQQSQLLKFIEEPSKTIHILLLAETEQAVLETLLNRCIKFYFKPYTIEELKQIKNVKITDVYEVCKTPGLLQSADILDFDELLTLCSKIARLISNASYANVLSISTKLNYKEEYDKFDVRLFFNTLTYCAKEEYIKSNSDTSYKVYMLASDYTRRLSLPAVNKEHLVLQFLDALYLSCKKSK